MISRILSGVSRTTQAVVVVALLGATAVGTVGYEGARDRVSDTFGPPIEKSKAFTARNWDRIENTADRAWGRCEEHPEQAVPSLVAILSILFTVLYFRRRGHSTRESLIAAVTRVAPTERSEPVPAEPRPRRMSAVARAECEGVLVILQRQLADLEAENKGGPSHIHALEGELQRAVRERDEAQKVLERRKSAEANVRAKLDEAKAAAAERTERVQEIKSSIGGIRADLDRAV